MRGTSALIAGLTVLAVTACEKREENTTINADTTVVATPAPAPAPAGAPAPGNVTLPAGVTAEMVTQGDQIYHAAGNCFTCHGPDAKGTQLAPDLTDSAWLNTDGSFEAIVGVIANGVATPKQYPAPMPAKGGSQITDDQVRAVAAYVYSISHAGQ